MATRGTPEQIRRLLEGHPQRTDTRAEYCRQQGIVISTLDYYLRRYRTKPARFVRVKIRVQSSETIIAFALAVRNGRRIESAWNFRDARCGPPDPCRRGGAAVS